MTGFLGELGKKAAERWLALLALPGLLYLAGVTIAVTLGHRHALDAGRLGRQITRWSADPSLKSFGGTALVLLAVLLGSVAVGFLADSLGAFVEILWTLPGRRAPARWLTTWRRERSRRAKARADQATSETEAARAIAAADRVSLLEADRPTWIGDRLHVARVRVEAVYGLDLDIAWPRLWLILPSEVRDELAAARTAVTASARLSAWAVLYLVLGAWWWPALLVAGAAQATAVLRARSSVGRLAELVEATVDLHAADLADRLRPAQQAYADPEAGPRLTTLMRKGRWDPRSTMAD
ncbi:hypothetical protein [Actinomadura fibrosa]|uniref:Vegetative cell wall protein gp1 n=1 Tax=Actinomadura fibrosa TaxID=111802 RepID=A0ABW2XQX3_9ACTN|nr:hypothetical protein [Actinomadura fibrosa]